MESSIFLFILPYFFACTLAATSPTILLNSSEPTSWLNDNSIDMNVNSTDGSKVRAILSRTRSLGFVSGFYCSTANCTSYYFGITVVGGGNPAMVWSANPDKPVSENANLTLTREGGLVLQNPDGSIVWSSRSTTMAGISVAGMNLTELGNLVLFNETGAVVWQSFDHPTDTLLAGQRLYEDQRLESGLYYATVTISGLAAFTGSQMYYQLKPEPNTTDQSSQRGRCPLITKIEVNTSDNAELRTKGFLENMGSNRSKLPLDLSVEYVRLNSDGSLKLYRHEPATRANEIVDMVTKDLGVCQHPRQCGDFGFCDEGICGCPKGVKGFKWKNDRCSRTTQLCQAPSDRADLDIKPQNILLDAKFNAKISDFGLSKLVDRDDSQVLITLRGTPGYIAPECGHSNITIKVDIYSFGIVLLEIVTGRKNLDGTRSEASKHLLSLMQMKAREDQLLDIVENLNEEMPENQEEMLRMIRIAAWCLQNDHTKRPLMSTVVKVLEGLMEVDPSISYDFTHAMGSASVASGHVSARLQSSVLSTPMQASVLSNPR